VLLLLLLLLLVLLLLVLLVLVLLLLVVLLVVLVVLVVVLLLVLVLVLVLVLLLVLVLVLPLPLPLQLSLTPPTPPPSSLCATVIGVCKTCVRSVRNNLVSHSSIVCCCLHSLLPHCNHPSPGGGGVSWFILPYSPLLHRERASTCAASPKRVNFPWSSSSASAKSNSTPPSILTSTCTLVIGSACPALSGATTSADRPTCDSRSFVFLLLNIAPSCSPVVTPDNRAASLFTIDCFLSSRLSMKALAGAPSASCHDVRLSSYIKSSGRKLTTLPRPKVVVTTTLPFGNAALAIGAAAATSAAAILASMTMDAAEVAAALAIVAAALFASAGVRMANDSSTVRLLLVLAAILFEIAEPMRDRIVWGKS
jgi:hypothetical protein